MADSETPTQSLEQEMPSLGRDGEPCGGCGSPLAADQRYCLECGRRRGGPRVDYRQRMTATGAASGSERPPAHQAPAEPSPQVATEQPAKTERDFAPLAAVGGIAVLGLMLLVGVLIGRGDGDSAPAPAPVLVPASAGTEAAQSGGEGGEGGGDLSLGGDSGKKGKRENANGGGEPAKDPDAVTASEGQLEELENESGEEAAKNALKLPNKIETEGEPPPIDKSKPPGGGEGGAVTIE